MDLFSYVNAFGMQNCVSDDDYQFIYGDTDTGVACLTMQGEPIFRIDLDPEPQSQEIITTAVKRIIAVVDDVEDLYKVPSTKDMVAQYDVDFTQKLMSLLVALTSSEEEILQSMIKKNPSLFLLMKTLDLTTIKNPAS
jgi:hypothetical protein